MNCRESRLQSSRSRPAAMRLMALAAMALPVLVFAAGEQADALSRWHHGPVRYLLRGPEVDLFRTLETDQQRLLFIHSFWARRDGNPESLENESRTEFWNRVGRANDLFTRTTVPGWRTDMGRVYIFLGPPYDRDVEVMPPLDPGITVPVPQVGGGGSGQVPTRLIKFGGATGHEVTRAVERWSYRGRKAAGLPNELFIVFRKGRDGDFELSTNPRDLERFAGMLGTDIPPLDGPMGVHKLAGAVRAPSAPALIADSTGTLSGDNLSLDMAGAGAASAALVSPFALNAFDRMALALDQGRLANVPSFEEFMGELITSQEFFGVMPFQVEVDFYGTTSDMALATITLGLPRGRLEPYLSRPRELDLAVRLQGIDQPAYRRILTGPGIFLPAPEDSQESGLLVMQALMQMPPGRYQLNVGVRAQAQGLIAAGMERIEVPDFGSRGLSLSSLVLAHRLEPLEGLGELTSDNATDPFRLGRYMVVPRLNRRLHDDESLSLYYQVYGARQDGDGAHLRAVYSLSRLDDDGETPVGGPTIMNDLRQSVQGWTLPLAGWPAGSYRLRLTMEDRLGGGTARGEVLFSVAGSQEEEPS